MVLANVQLANSGDIVNIGIEQDKIDTLSSTTINANGKLLLHFDDAIVFPGLINSHDHLDFNLFPQLGNRVYNNYTEWGGYIHKEFKQEIARVLSVPQHLRILWGVYKNLLCGVTTVVNHGERLSVNSALINIFENTHDLHSVAFEKLWKLKLNNPLKRTLPVVIHAGEGTDKQAEKEINSLINWNKLRRDLVGIHAVAMSKEQARRFKAIVWCPQSNYYLLNKSAPINQLKPLTHILFGTDSTLTSNWNIWDHIAMARNTHMLSDEELFLSLNKTAANVWKTNNGEITEGKTADLIVAKAKGGTDSYKAFYATQPADIQLVMQGGRVRLFDQHLLPKLAAGLKGQQFSLIQLGDSFKYIAGDIGQLITGIQIHLPEAAFPVNFVHQQIF